MDDDDGIVETVSDKIVINKPSSTGSVISIFTSIIYSPIEFIQSYGWFILIFGLILYYIYNKYKSRFTSSSNSYSRSSREHSKIDEAAELKKMLEIEEARKRQQAAMDAAVAKFKEEQKLKEQKKSEEKVEDYERLLDGKSKLVKNEEAKQNDSSSMSKPNDKPRLRPTDYNPLTGGGGACYRPTKRGGNRGGG